MINVFGSKVGKEEIEQITDSISKQWMGMGPKTKAFESKMAKRLQQEKFILVDSGSNGLFMALTLLELPKGSEVIVPSFTWVSCAQVVMMAGCVPVFCDVDINSQNVTAPDTSVCCMISFKCFSISMQTWWLGWNTGPNWV